MSVFKLRVGNESDVSVETIEEGVTLSQYIRSIVDSREWERALPSVRPFYAVKCNEDPALLQTLAALGTGFDCASKAEIKTILELGVAPERIIYANPCKQISHIKYAARKGVDMMTFDNELELFKIKSHFPAAKLVLRIRADDPNAVCQLGIKFGCSLGDGRELLNTAKELGLNVIGVSFHVGSGCQTPSAYQEALAMSAEMFEYGASIGYRFTLLDIGGGYPGEKGSEGLFKKVTDAINEALTKYFPPSKFPNLDVIAEPGRYFACSTHALAVNVFAKRPVVTIDDGANGGDNSRPSPSFMYYVNDGIYGSFNCIMFDHYTVVPSLLRTPLSECLYPTSFWGPTCDGLDKICDTTFPELYLGDFVYFDNMGAYTVAASSSFNGFQRPKSYYYIDKENLEKFMRIHQLSLTQPTEDKNQESVAVACVSPSLSPSPSEEMNSMQEISVGVDSFGPPLVRVF